MLIKVIPKYPVVCELFLYGLIGVFSAGLDSVVFVLLRSTALSLYVANFVSINVGIVCSFVLNTYFNFKVKNKILRRATTFFAVGYSGLGLSMVILFFGIEKLGKNEIAVKLVSIFTVAIFQFILNKFITYKRND